MKTTTLKKEDNREYVQGLEKKLAHLDECYGLLRTDFLQMTADRNAAREDLGLVKDERDRLMTVSRQFAEAKERDADTIARLTQMMYQVVGEYNAFQKEVANKT